MKRIINTLVTIMSVISAIVIICTFLTSYQFIYIGDIFNTYSTIQICLAITMAIWGVKFWIEELGKRKIIYPIICFGISIASIFFIFCAVR